MKKLIVVSLQVEGLHCWPKCNIEEVLFLRHPHRHIFHITCKKEVSHNDRDIEIIQLKRRIQHELYVSFFSHFENTHDFEDSSCEYLAEWLTKRFQLTYCQVLEDNENGAEIWA